MLTAMIFAANADAQSRIQRRCIALGDLNVFRSLEYKPSPPDMLRLIQAYGPELALIEFETPGEVQKVEEMIHAFCPTVTILGFAENWDHQPVIKGSQRSIRILNSRVSLEEFREAILHAMAGDKTPDADNVIVFLPGKAGSGASSMALNVTGALANKCGKKVILIEADLHSGPAGMYLNLESTSSVADALEESHSLEERWDSLITRVGNVHILPASNIRGAAPQPSGWAYRRLLAYARNRYDYVVFDLPEVVNEATEVVVTSARAVYLVCTPEVPSLVLTRRRLSRLVERGVCQDRVHIVLNRYSKGGPDTAAIAEILHSPVRHVIPNEYNSILQANLKRNLVDERSILGRAFESFARQMAGVPAPQEKSGRKMFGLFSGREPVSRDLTCG